VVCRAPGRIAFGEPARRFLAQEISPIGRNDSIVFGSERM